MHIQPIKACELAQFIESDLYRKLSAYPITKHRAISQTKNPRALPDDIILIIAYTDDFELLGNIGALPDDLFIGDDKIHIAWNSCWWSHPIKGKPVVMKLFAAMQKAWNYQMCFSDLNEQGKNFLELTNKYNLNPYQGYKFIYRFYLSRLATSKIKYLNNPITKIILGFADFWLNSVISLLQYTKYPYDTEKIKSTIYQSPTQDMIDFIEKNRSGNISGRNLSDFNWILENPWIVTDKITRKQYSGKYFFSHTANSFQNYFLVFRESNKITGVFFIQERDGQYRLPYAFMEREKLENCGKGLLLHLLKSRANSLVVYHPEIAGYIKTCDADITKKKLTRYTAFPKDMNLKTESVYIQDGDGDAVFC
jgi:hypothetical protein